MAEPKEARSTLPGLYAKSGKRSVTGIEMVATALTVGWILLSGWYFLTSDGTPTSGLRFLMVLMVIVLPTAMIWVAAITMRTSQTMREESASLKAAIDALRNAYVQNTQTGKTEAAHPSILKRLDDLAGAQKNVESTLAMIGGIRQGEQSAPPAVSQGPELAEDQPVLSLGTPAEALRPPLSNADFVRALHFPETADDEEGFAALRRALKDRNAAKLIQAAQDVLTLLSQDGIYMDDLSPDMARPEVWRAFAQGARGRTVAGLGGVHDRSSLALAAGRMKQDPIFRDATHHFLRRYDQNFVSFEPHASDEEISAFASTRTSRAFMLLGRVAGTFD